MTTGAQHFVGSTTFSALASEPVRTSLWEGSDPIPHTTLGQGADLVLVAPATARVLAAYAHGLSTDLLTNILIATRAPVLMCPAMHTEMWEHPAVEANIELLRSRGVHIVEPEAGRLAGGDIGKGRLADPADIVAAAQRALADRDLEGLNVVVTAGGTREPIDAVRMIANRSSGKQGHAISEECVRRGANVTVVTTTELPTSPIAGRIQVETAAEMQAALDNVAATADIVIMAAAVADFRPKDSVDGKIKKAGGVPEVILEPTPDLLEAIGQNRQPHQTIVGFAAETDDLVTNAQSKLERKCLDLVVANDVSAEGVGFAHGTNAVTLVSADGERDLTLRSKAEIAVGVVDEIVRIRMSMRSVDAGRVSRTN
jgi:phosphopantothenoylcysteine decarboxylase/phosphopantothenate--cysteine ligase